VVAPKALEVADDLTSLIAKDTGHPVYNSIPGRYVNRIGHGQYTLDGKVYHTEQNDGNNTLHSGTNNWSYRVWNVDAASAGSITFSISDPDGSEKGLPGLVNSSVTYSVTSGTLHAQPCYSRC
jgi:aldose 1-epimerase